MNVRRILQLLFTTLLGQGITVISQLLIPPFFLRFFGLEVYGEWIALSASVDYLGTLNYGIQNYANNQTTILYNGGDERGAKDIQASAFRLLLLLFVSFAVIGLAVFFIPIASWLKLKHENEHIAALTLYLLILRVAFNMMFSLLANSYMVVGKLHRGNYFQSAQRLFMVLAMAIAIFLHASFPVLAAIQLVRRVAPVLLPSLRYGSWKQVRQIIKPSGHFGLIAMAGFLTWQGPVLIIQIVLGSAQVGIFQLVRTVFQMSRQILSIASNTISQDITLLVGKNDWRQLRRLYDLSERIVLFLIPIVSIGSLLMCPFLFTVWLHKRNLYDWKLCCMMAIISAVLGIKEHKTQFQSSSNKHEDLSIFILVGYAIMLLISVGTMKFLGLYGFLGTWLIWEMIQTQFVLGLNDKMFPEEHRISTKPVVHLTIFMTVAFLLSAYPAYREVNWGLGWTVLCAVTVTAAFGIAGYFVFEVDEVRGLLAGRFKKRFAPKPSTT